MTRRQLSELSSERLAGLAREGSGEAFELLTERHRDAVLACLYQKVGNAADAEDLAQEVFARVYRALHSFDTGRNFKAWLFTIASRLAISHYRRRAVEPSVTVSELEIPQESTQPADRDAARELWARAELVLGMDLFDVLWKRYGEGMTVAEIARLHKKSKTGITVSLYRARIKLRKDKAFRDICGV